MLFVAITSTPVLQTLAIGTAIFLDTRDGRPNAVFPRWAGYLNYWVAMLFLPGTVTVFFHTGPFAWNGLLTWYLPLTVFAIWMVTMSVLLLNAIDAEDAELQSVPADTDLAEQLRELRAEVARLAERKVRRYDLPQPGRVRVVRAAMTLLFFIGLLPIGHFIWPPAPSLSAEQIAAWFAHDTVNKRLGLFIAMLGTGYSHRFTR